MMNPFGAAFLAFATATAPTDATAGATGGDMASVLLTTVLPFALLIAVFYFMVIRPQKKREKADNDMRNNLEVGDEVTTRGGIIGHVCNIKDDIITVETGASKIRINVQRWAITSKDTKVSD